MTQRTERLTIETHGQGLYEFTGRVKGWVQQTGIRTGLLTIFVQHTSASLTIQENADPDVCRDLTDFFARLVPEDDALYVHTIEGSDDMPAHIRAALTQTQLSIPVIAGAPALGTWQGIYLFEHRRRAYRRSVVLHVTGE